MLLEEATCEVNLTLPKGEGVNCRRYFAPTHKQAQTEPHDVTIRQVQRHDAAGATGEGKFRKDSFGPISAPSALQCCLYGAGVVALCPSVRLSALKKSIIPQHNFYLIFTVKVTS